MKAEDPYASIEKDQLISMIHFLVKREEERAQENQKLKNMVRELRETRESLIRSFDLLPKQLADSSNEKAALLQKIDDLMSMISVSNKVRFGSINQKVQRRRLHLYMTEIKTRMDSVQQIPHEYSGIS